MLYPLTFQPIFKERVWGGRELERLYHKALPPGLRVGESWEISDRPGDVSIITNGPLAGRDLHWLVKNHPAQLFGQTNAATRPPNHRTRTAASSTLDPRPPTPSHFPLLIKILDAREKLSLQVHPPAKKAAQLGGEPKTELWYVAHAAPNAELYVGLKRGVTRQEFEKKTRSGSVADCFHRLKVREGDALFLPSGRVHALGAGLVIFEIQQNSDTTYRVFDWNRLGLDGKPRELHIAESLASIDFEDFEPKLVPSKFTGGGGSFNTRHLVQHSLFTVDCCWASRDVHEPHAGPHLQILGLLKGNLEITAGDISVSLTPGQFCLLPAVTESPSIRYKSNSVFLRIVPG
ncbi:MAG: mannose-6-phosphate isomerase [Verrucomicrobia bacterium]|nr:MAG: mannose-6-phosphate isomerase [Verrucomicrobiota bacterium]